MKRYEGCSLNVLGCPSVRRIRLEKCVNLCDVEGLEGLGGLEKGVRLKHLEIVRCPRLDLGKYVGLEGICVVLKN